MSRLEICILAGGLSTRMGRDKARMRLAGKTLLGHVREVARQTKYPVRVIRHDLVKRCGPLGGIYTGLRTTATERVLFLACDMPFVTAELIENLIDIPAAKDGAIFTRGEGGGKCGFPFILPRVLLPEIERQLKEQNHSLQRLAMRCQAEIFEVPGGAPVLFNVNTPSDWEWARQWLVKVGPVHAWTGA